MIARLAVRSAWNRADTLILTVLSIALATFLLLAVERLRTDVRESFSQSVSGTDLIVGARTGSVQLMLYAVFRVGSATNNIRMDSVNAIAQHRAVAWVVPISLGDSHRGFAVLGTSPEYFERFRYGDKQALVVQQGRPFAGTLDGLYEAVIGAEVAAQLNYAIRHSITLTHGAGSALGNEHADKPFTVVGVLAPTGTPVDRSVHVSLQAIEAIHLDWAGGAPLPGMQIPADAARKFDLQPKEVTAVLVGLRSRAAVFAVQRFIANFEAEPLMAVLPGVALDELWQTVGIVERALQIMSTLVAFVSVAGLVAVVMAGLNERRRELAVLRAVGAAPRHILALLATEAVVVTATGAALGIVALVLAVLLAGPWLQAHQGIALRLSAPTASQAGVLLGIGLAGLLAGLVPGWRAYRMSLADGLSPRS